MSFYLSDLLDLTLGNDRTEIFDLDDLLNGLAILDQTEIQGHRRNIYIRTLQKRQSDEFLVEQ